MLWATLAGVLYGAKIVEMTLLIMTQWSFPDKSNEYQTW